MKSTIRALSELGVDIVLAPERHLALQGTTGTPLGELVEERRERATDLSRAIVLDTTHVRDGLLDPAGALRDAQPAKSAKKAAYPGDLLVSRLRPYLRQIAYVHPRAIGKRALAVSPEFFVLTPRAGADGELAWLLPFLLGEDAQRALAAAQEGGHHPRVPRDSLFGIRVPDAAVRARRSTNRSVIAALAALYRADAAFRSVLG